MKRIIIFSSQPGKEKLFSISFEEAKKSVNPVVLVLLKEDKEEDMKKLSYALGKKPIISFDDYVKQAEPEDELYLLSEVLNSSPQKNFLSTLSGLFNRKSLGMV